MDAEHVVPSIYNMQQSTVWWTRQDHKRPTKYGGGTNWFETNQSRGINNEEHRGYEPRS